MHRTMVFVIIFTMILLDIEMVFLCCGGGGSKSRYTESEDDYPRQWLPPPYSSNGEPSSSFSNKPQSVKVPKVTYYDVCVKNPAKIPNTREIKSVKATEEGKVALNAKDGNIAVCARQTKFMNYMEDKYDMRKIVNKGISLFALYDGHGGAEVAECAAKNLLHNIEEKILKQQDEYNIPYEEILKLEIQKFDKKLKEVYDWELANRRPIQLEEEDVRMGRGGSTALIGLIDKNKKLYVANLGDTHGEMCCKSDGNPIPLSNDFDVTNITPNEKSRIEKAGGNIKGDCMVYKKIPVCVSVTRGLGDFEFKDIYENPVISYEAEIKVIDLKNDDFDAKYILFATDGAWPRLSKEKVDAKKAFEQIGEKYTDADAYYGSLNLCTYIENEMNSSNKDNITVMVVNLRDILDKK